MSNQHEKHQSSHLALWLTILLASLITGTAIGWKATTDICNRQKAVVTFEEEVKMLQESLYQDRVAAHDVANQAARNGDIEKAMLIDQQLKTHYKEYKSKIAEVYLKHKRKPPSWVLED